MAAMRPDVGHSGKPYLRLKADVLAFVPKAKRLHFGHSDSLGEWPRGGDSGRADFGSFSGSPMTAVR